MCRFSPASASFVLQRFSQYGNIRSHHTASNGGNWMHVQYETSLQARKALSRNGKVLPGNMMIGVVPCIDVVSFFYLFNFALWGVRIPDKSYAGLL